MTDTQKLKYDLAMNCARVIVEAQHVYKPDKNNAAELYAALLDEFAECCRGISKLGDNNEEQIKEALEYLRAE